MIRREQVRGRGTDASSLAGGTPAPLRCPSGSGAQSAPAGRSAGMLPAYSRSSLEMRLTIVGDEVTSL